MVSIFSSWSVVAFPDLSDPSSLAKHVTSDNQRLGTSNDTTSVVEHPTLKVNWIEVLTIRWPVFRVDKLG